MGAVTCPPRRWLLAAPLSLFELASLCLRLASLYLLCLCVLLREAAGLLPALRTLPFLGCFFY
jgi:hypothetical protein